MKQAKFLGLRAVFYGTVVNDQAWSSARGLPARFLTPHEPVVGKVVQEASLNLAKIEASRRANPPGRSERASPFSFRCLLVIALLSARGIKKRLQLREAVVGKPQNEADPYRQRPLQSA